MHEWKRTIDHFKRFFPYETIPIEWIPIKKWLRFWKDGKLLLFWLRPSFAHGLPLKFKLNGILHRNSCIFPIGLHCLKWNTMARQFNDDDRWVWRRRQWRQRRRRRRRQRWTKLMSGFTMMVWRISHARKAIVKCPIYYSIFQMCVLVPAHPMLTHRPVKRRRTCDHLTVHCKSDRPSSFCVLPSTHHARRYWPLRP